MLATILAIILTAGAPACEYEDGSSQRYCIWNASVQGNGQGTSGIIIRGGTDHAKWIAIPHRVARNLTR